MVKTLNRAGRRCWLCWLPPFSFAALTAVGRVCLGIDAAAAARYVPYALPALLALVIAVRAWIPASLQLRALGALLAVFVAKETLVSLRPIRETTLLVDGKQRFRACLLDRAGDAAAANVTRDSRCTQIQPFRGCKRRSTGCGHGGWGRSVTAKSVLPPPC